MRLTLRSSEGALATSLFIYFTLDSVVARRRTCEPASHTPIVKCRPAAIRAMKPFLLVCTLLIFGNSAIAGQLIGTFESVRFDLLRDQPAVTAKDQEAYKLNQQKMVVTETEIMLKNAVGGITPMHYTAQGDFLMGRATIGHTEMFYPIYVADADTLFFGGNKFVRIAK